MDYYDRYDFDLKYILENINDRKVFIVFSTLGERESDLIYAKVKLLKDNLINLNYKVVLSHRRTDSQKKDITEKKAADADANCEIFVCNNYKVADMGDEKGKGADMRRVLHFINTAYQIDFNDIVIFLDSDVKDEYFGIHFVINLLGAIIKGNDFAKAGFWREMGRVKKYLAQPLFSSINNTKLDLLKNFSYPLSGEVAGTIKILNSVNFWQIYGIETGIIVDLAMKDIKCADVNLGKYDHEHSSDANIQKMAFGIIRTFLMQLESYDLVEFKNGTSISDNFTYSFINEDQKKQDKSFNLSEIKYVPLNEIL